MNATTAFSFLRHSFSSVELNFENVSLNDSIDIDFNPSGVYDSSTGIYTLKFEFRARHKAYESQQTIALIICNAQFKFNDNISLCEIPDFFYPNSIAIVFPYVRAFVGSVSLLANIEPPIVLPTLNLTSLKDTLKNNTKLI